MAEEAPGVVCWPRRAMATVVEVSEIEAFADGVELRGRFSLLEPRTVLLDFGGSSFGRAVVAIRAVDAVAARFPRARIRVDGTSAVRRLLEAHLQRQGRIAATRSDRADLRVDFRPAARGGSAWLDGELPTLRVSAGPYPSRPQHAGRHFVDGARSAGLDVVDAPPVLQLPRAAHDRARALIRERLRYRPLVVLHRRARGWHAFGALGEQLKRRLGAAPWQISGRIAGMERLDTRDPLLVAAVLRLACVVVCDAGSVSHLAAAVGAPVVSLHSRSSPVRHGPACALGIALYAECRQRQSHQASKARGLRCLDCLPLDRVLAAAEELAARRWPWDQLARLGLSREP